MQLEKIIVILNFIKSKKFKEAIIEIYSSTGKIIKNNQYSGPLRSIDIDKIEESKKEILKRLFEQMRRINKNTFQIHSNLYMILEKLKNEGVLFYRGESNKVYKVDEIIKLTRKEGVSINKGLSLAGDFGVCKLYIDAHQAAKKKPKILGYIDLKVKSLEIHINHETNSYMWGIDDSLIKNILDFNERKSLIDFFKSGLWIWNEDKGLYIYRGNNFTREIEKLIDMDVEIYTTTNKKVVKPTYDFLKLSYEIDWFSIEGYVKVQEEKIEANRFFELLKGDENWIPYDELVILKTKSLNNKDLLNISRIPVKQLPHVINVANVLNKDIHNFTGVLQSDAEKLQNDSKLLKILKGYQKEGVKWLLSLWKHGFGACLCDDMGLGKTLQVLAFLSDKKLKDKKILIVVPYTLVQNWIREFYTYTKFKKINIYHGPLRNINEENNITITTFKTLANDIEVLSKHSFDVMIVDEAQFAKNSKSQANNALMCIKTKCNIILTGTPFENNIFEFLAIMKLANPSIFEKVKSMDRGFIKRISAPFILRRTKEEVLKELPKKIQHIVYCEMNDQQKYLYDKILKVIRDELNKPNSRFIVKNSSIIMLKGLLYLQEVCCDPRLLPKKYNGEMVESCKKKALIDKLLEVRRENQKVVIFSRFTKMLNILQKEIGKLGIQTFYIDGQTKDRLGVVDSFEKAEGAVALISLKAGGTGINLISANKVFIYDPWWNPYVEKQAEDRVYRIGQNKDVDIYRFVVKDSIEEKVQELQRIKNEIGEDLLEGNSNIQKKISNELKELYF